MAGYRNRKGIQRRQPKLIAARVYQFLEGNAPKPVELTLAENISKYGVWGIMGRPLYYQETREINAAENIYSWYQARSKAESIAEWCAKYPVEAAALDEAMKYGEC